MIWMTWGTPPVGLGSKSHHLHRAWSKGWILLGKHTGGSAESWGSPVVTIGFNTKSWSFMTWIIHWANGLHTSKKSAIPFVNKRKNLWKNSGYFVSAIPVTDCGKPINVDKLYLMLTIWTSFEIDLWNKLANWWFLMLGSWGKDEITSIPPKHGIPKGNMPDELQLQRGSDQKRSGFQQTRWGIHIMNLCIDRWMDEWMDG